MPRLVRQRWEGQAGGFGETARTFWYEAFVPDPIAEIDPALPLSAAEALAEAERTVLALAATPELAGLEALNRQLLRAESVASSRIEGLQLSHGRLARADFDPGAADRTARSVVGNIVYGACHRPRASAEDRDAEPSDVHRTLFAGTDDERLGGLAARAPELDRRLIRPPTGRVRPAAARRSALLRTLRLREPARRATCGPGRDRPRPVRDDPPLRGRQRSGGRALIHVILRRRASRWFVPLISLAAGQRPLLRGGPHAYRTAIADEHALRPRAPGLTTANRPGRPSRLWTRGARRAVSWRTSAAQRSSAGRGPSGDRHPDGNDVPCPTPGREAVLGSGGGVLIDPIGRKQPRVEAPALLDLLDDFEPRRSPPPATRDGA
jgi:hypothetical protein